MSAYRQLLVAIDLGEQSRAVAEKSAELARLWQARLQLLHVIEFVPVEPMSDALVPVVQIDDRLIARARECGADLIVLGCRERHGLSILVNFTEDTVLHGAPCDVLALRVR